MPPEKEEEKVEETLIERLSTNPDAIAEMDKAELETARAELKEAGKEAHASAKDAESSVADRTAALEAAKEAADRIATIDERLAEFAAESEDIDKEADEIGAVFETEEEEEDEEPEADEEETAADDEPEVEGELEIEVDQPEKQPVAASIGALAKRTPKPPAPKKGLVASAGPALAGQMARFDTPLEMGDGALRLWNSYGRSTKVDAKAIVASFDTSNEYEYEVTGDIGHDGPVIDALLKDLRSKKTVEALTAAAGICAPAEPLYDYFGIAERAGMIQLPTLNASRGAITYRTSPSYASVLANASWSGAAGQVYTDANAQSGASKNTFDIECPATVTCTVDGFPVILTFTNFTDRFDPETVANSIENSMIFHDHYVNAQHIATMVSASTAMGGGDTGGGGLVNVANLVNFEAAKYRDTYRMSPDAVLELVAPAWVRDALVADLVARNATTDLGNARGRVAALFASLNVRVQWVQDWQSIGDAGDTGWRTAADFILFAPGTFVRLDGGNIDLGIVRDSTLNATNEFQTFTESFEAVCEVGHDSWLLDDITICPRGGAGADVTLDCNPGFGS